MIDKDSSQDTPVKSSTIDVTLRIMGFVADLTAIGSILLAIKLPNLGQSLPLIVSPIFAFGIWMIGAYLYVSYLHKYWKENSGKNLWAKRFSVFLVGELIIKFRRPFLLLPGLVWIVALVWIGATVGIPTAVYIPFLITVAIAVVIVFVGALEGKWGYDDFAKYFVKPLNEAEFVEGLNKAKAIVDRKWRKLKPIVEKKLDRYRWLAIEDFKEISVTEELTEDMMKYALIKYAAENPSETCCGNVYGKDRWGDPVLHEENVLVNCERFDKDPELKGYYYE